MSIDEKYASNNASPSASVHSKQIDVDRNQLDDLNDEQLEELVSDLETEHKHWILENKIFINFLNANDYSAIEDEFLIATKKKLSHTESSTGSVMSSKFSKLRFGSSRGSIVENAKVPRINVTQKTELVLHLMEEIQIALEKCRTKWHRTRCNLKAELEEISVRDSELHESMDIFDTSVIIEGLDKLTQRIPAEKFIRFMHEWLRSVQFSIEKLRLRTGTMRSQYGIISTHLTQRIELGENIRGVDFEKLRIENVDYLKTIDEKNKFLLELKQMIGSTNLVLTAYKKHLLKSSEEYNKIEKAIKLQEKKIKDLKMEFDVVMGEFNIAKNKYVKYKYMIQTYNVPHVIEYVKTKSQLHELERSIGMRKRRISIQNIALNACVIQMKNITGYSMVRNSWFQFKESKYVEDNEELLADKTHVFPLKH